VALCTFVSISSDFVMYIFQMCGCISSEPVEMVKGT